MKFKRSGFSLVLSLTVMSGMVLMVIVLASFLQIESRLAQSQAGQQRARLNAMAAARIAIGQLQLMMGPDQRVSMRADMYADDHTPPGRLDHASVGRPNSIPRWTDEKVANPNAPIGKISHNKRYWTGVWATGGVNSEKVRDWNVAIPHDSRLFLGWLVSPARASSIYPDEIDATDASASAGNPPGISIQHYSPNRSYFNANGTANMTDGQALIDGLSSPFVSSAGASFSSPDQLVAAVVPLVSRGTVSWPEMFNGDRIMQQYFGAVDAIPLPLPGAYRDGASRTNSAPNGRFAYWIGDEGIKAKVNLPDAFAHDSAGVAMKGLTDWERALTASAAQRNAFELAAPVASSTHAADTRLSHPSGVPPSFGADFSRWRNADIQSAPNPASLQLARAYTPAEVILWAQLQSGGSAAAAETMRNALRALWPDVTTYSFSTLTDVYSGGPKADLSTAFELPYSIYRTLEVYPGQKASTTPVAQRAQTFFHGAQGPTDLDFNRPNLVDKLGTAAELLRASPRASEWAARYIGPATFSAPLTQIRARNGGETPERLGFAYEVPIAPAFFNSVRLDATRVSATGVVQHDALPWRGLAADHQDNLMGQIIRGPTWDLYRNWYRIYKREMEEAAKNGGLRGMVAPTDANTFVSRGLEPLTYATGNRERPIRSLWPVTPTDTNANKRFTDNSELVPPTNNPLPDVFYADGTAVDLNRYFHRNNLADGNVQPLFQAERRRQIPFDQQQALQGSAAGIIRTGFPFTAAAGLQVPTVLSPPTGAVTQITDGRYAYNGSLGNSVAQTTRTAPTAPALMPSVLRFSLVYSGVRTGSELGITIDPIIVLHNPYDAPIEFEGVAMVANAWNTPLLFTFELAQGFYWSTERMYKWRYNDSLVINGVPHTEFKPSSHPLAANPTNSYNDQLLPGGVNAKYTNWQDQKVLSLGNRVAIGDTTIGAGVDDNRSFSFKIIAGDTTSGGSRTIKMNPGQVMVISTSRSTAGNDFSAGKNVSIPGDVGFSLDSRAFYKMTPYSNIRGRAVDRDGELVLWNRSFDDCKDLAAYWSNSLGKIFKWSDFVSGNYTDVTYGDRLRDLLSDTANARKARDAVNFWTPGSGGTFDPSWDSPGRVWNGKIGGPQGLEEKLWTRPPLVVRARNTGYIPYNGMVAGGEGENISVDRSAVDPTTREPLLRESYSVGTGYEPPSYRRGAIGVRGNQSWNFYLLGKRSIDNKPLDAGRRWFGTPDDSRLSYKAATGTESGRRIRSYREGSETVNGFNLVDEDLLLNFQALCSGWPMYSNSNNDESYFVQRDNEWLERLSGVPQPDPNYYMKGSWAASASQVPTDPEFSNLDPSNARPIEMTHDKANTMNNMGLKILSYGTTKEPIYIMDFVRRSAEMTAKTQVEVDALNAWYPRDTGSNKFGNNPVPKSTHLDRMQTQETTLQAPTTPFMIGHRAQQAQLFGYDGMAHAPLGWVQTQRMLSSFEDDAAYGSDVTITKLFWGRSLFEERGGTDSVILFPLPRRPLLSISQLGTAPVAEISTDADFTVGSSFAHPGIGDLTKVVDWPGPRGVFESEKTAEFTSLHQPDASKARGPMPELGFVAKAMGSRPVRNRTAPRVDHAFASNLALWDGFYFSGLNLPANSYSPAATPNAWPGGPDLATDQTVKTLQEEALIANGVTNVTFAGLKVALEEGRNPLANKRVAFIPDGRQAANLASSLSNYAQALTEADFPHPKYLARNSLYNGGFNVNSTSKAAWKTVLGALRGTPLPGLESGSGTTSALTKFSRAIGGTGTDGSEPWTKHRELTDAQIDELAERVVAEVRGRGPFMSLADFINRRLVNSEIYGLKGALQAAIDKADLESDATRRINLTAIVNSGGTFDAPNAPDPGRNWYDPNIIRSNGNTLPGNVSTFDGTFSSPWFKESSAYPKFDSKIRFPSIRSMSRTNQEDLVTSALGAPGLITQMDVLNSIGPNITARSDTFVIRAYGEALDSAGKVIGKAWVEVVVQRGMQYLSPGANQTLGDDPNRRRLAYRSDAAKAGYVDGQPLVEMHERTPGANSGLPNINRLFGRRFRAVSVKWLSPNEI